MALDNVSQLKAGDILGRELPYSLEAEQAVLGGVLLDPSVLPKVIEILRPDYFYRPQHQQLFFYYDENVYGFSDRGYYYRYRRIGNYGGF